VADDIIQRLRVAFDKQENDLYVVSNYKGFRVCKQRSLLRNLMQIRSPNAGT
jgi:hypothetical protein